MGREWSMYRRGGAIVISPSTTTNKRRNTVMEGLYSKIIKAGDKTYFVDVREAKNKSRYLAISETRPSSEGEKKFSRSKIVVFADHIEAFRESFNEAADLVTEKVG